MDENTNYQQYEKQFKEKTGLDFNDYYRKYRPKLVWFLMKYTKNKELAEDFAQDAFIQSLHKIHQYDVEKAGYITWLSKMARNLVIRNYNDQKRLPTTSIDKKLNNDSNLTDYIEYDDGSTIKQQFNLSNHKAKLVKDTIDVLPFKYQKVMTMREINKMSYKDIAYNIRIKNDYVVNNDILILPRTLDFIKITIKNEGVCNASLLIKSSNDETIFKSICPGDEVTLTEKDIKWLKSHNDIYKLYSHNTTCVVNYETSTNLSTIKSRIRQGRKLINKKLQRKFNIIDDIGI